MARYIDIEPIEKAAKERGYDAVTLALIEEQKTADVRKNTHAKWVIEKEIVNGVLHSCQFCSNCDYPQYLTTKFCPNCGAMMDEVTE